MTPKPPAKRLPTDQPTSAVLWLIVGVFFQIVQAVNVLIKKSARSAARSRLGDRLAEMGRQMAEAGVGDQLALQKIQSLPQAAPERLEVLKQHGRAGIETGVPLLGLETAYRDGREALIRAQDAERAHDGAVFRLWPHDTLGWIALALNYLLVVAAVVWLILYLTAKPVPPASAADLSAQLGPATVRITSTVIGRDERRKTGQDKTVIVDDNLLLKMQIEVRNDGTDPFPYTTWRGEFNALQDSGAKAVDNRGRSLGRFAFKKDDIPEGGVGTAKIAPGESVADLLIFAPPEPKFGSLELFLPGENLGRPGETLRIVIPADRVAVPDTYK